MKDSTNQFEWNDIKELWKKEPSVISVRIQLHDLIDELSSKVSSFEHHSIKSDMRVLKQSWHQYEDSISHFEKQSIARDLNLLSAFIARLKKLFK